MTKPILSARYQLKPNLYAFCHVTPIAFEETGIHLHVGIRPDEAITIPIGTKIYFTELKPSDLPQGAMQGSGPIACHSVTVQQVGKGEDPFLLVCTTVLTECFSERRKMDRMPVDFNVINQADVPFNALNGTTAGIGMADQSHQAIVHLKLNQPETFRITYKDKLFEFQGQVKHIQYDWNRHEHQVGVHFMALRDEQETVLKFLINPDYTVDMPTKQTVDASSGKISSDL